MDISYKINKRRLIMLKTVGKKKKITDDVHKISKVYEIYKHARLGLYLSLPGIKHCNCNLVYCE